MCHKLATRERIQPQERADKITENTSRTAAGECNPASRLPYPAGIGFLIEERPLLWYEDPDEYDQLLRVTLEQMSPEGVLECLFVKNLVDCIWELRRMKRMKQVGINFAMPHAARRLLTTSREMRDGHVGERIEDQAIEMAYSGPMEARDGDPSLAERMQSMCLSPEMLHYETLKSEAERLNWISGECDRLESRLHRLLRDFEGRRAALKAMARNLIDRERAEVVEFRAAN